MSRLMVSLPVIPGLLVAYVLVLMWHIPTVFYVVGVLIPAIAFVARVPFVGVWICKSAIEIRGIFGSTTIDALDITRISVGKALIPSPGKLWFNAAVVATKSKNYRLWMTLAGGNPQDDAEAKRQARLWNRFASDHNIPCSVDATSLLT